MQIGLPGAFVFSRFFFKFVFSTLNSWVDLYVGVWACVLLRYPANHTYIRHSSGASRRGPSTLLQINGASMGVERSLAGGGFNHSTLTIRHQTPSSVACNRPGGWRPRAGGWSLAVCLKIHGLASGFVYQKSNESNMVFQVHEQSLLDGVCMPQC